jgi:hypothetical protein
MFDVAAIQVFQVGNTEGCTWQGIEKAFESSCRIYIWGLTGACGGEGSERGGRLPEHAPVDLRAALLYIGRQRLVPHGAPYIPLAMVLVMLW